MRRLATVLSCLVLALVLAPTAALAVTPEQIVAMKKAGVSDAVILALIERDHTVFTLQPEQIMALQKEGLSEELILAMLRTAQAGDEAARASSADASAAIAADMATGPQVLIVGHGPERPSTYHYDGFFTSVNNPYLFPFYQASLFSSPPYGAVPQAPGVLPLTVAPRVPRLERLAPRALCAAQVYSSTSGTRSLSFLSECPQPVQPRRAR